MTTPASNTSAQRCIYMAMEDAGLLQDGAEPTGDQYGRYLQRLNDMINLWQTQGLKLWLQVDQSIPLVVGQAMYALKPGGDVNMTKPLRAAQGYYQDSAGGRSPLTVLSRDEYVSLPQVTSRGAVNSFFVDKRQLELDVYVWLVPDAAAATGTLHLILQTQATGIVSITDSSSFPQEWFIALRWGLADEISTGQPQAIMQRCEARARSYREALEDWDVEDAATVFQPDARGLSSARW